MGKELFQHDTELAVSKRGERMSDLPVYTDGCFGLYRIRTDESKDYPEEYLEDQNMEIWYKEISVFDHMKYELGQGGMEVTMKIGG